jgi:hypothetical protein
MTATMLAHFSFRSTIPRHNAITQYNNHFLICVTFTYQANPPSQTHTLPSTTLHHGTPEAHSRSNSCHPSFSNTSWDFFCPKARASESAGTTITIRSYDLGGMWKPALLPSCAGAVWMPIQPKTIPQINEITNVTSPHVRQQRIYTDQRRNVPQTPLPLIPSHLWPSRTSPLPPLPPRHPQHLLCPRHQRGRRLTYHTPTRPRRPLRRNTKATRRIRQEEKPVAASTRTCGLARTRSTMGCLRQCRLQPSGKVHVCVRGAK